MRSSDATAFSTSVRRFPNPNICSDRSRPRHSNASENPEKQRTFRPLRKDLFAGSALGHSLRPVVTLPLTDEVHMPHLSPEVVADLAQFGAALAYEPGDIVWDAGIANPPFFVVVDGEIIVVDPDDEARTPLAIQSPGTFSGELGLLIGQRSFLRMVATQPTHVIAIAPQEFRRLLNSKPDVA